MERRRIEYFNRVLPNLVQLPGTFFGGGPFPFPCFHAAHDDNGRFFLNGYKEEYPNCKFPTFNSGKTIERQLERGLHEQYFF
jgi:hypothetical protein